MQLIKQMEDPKGHVCKFVFTDDEAVTEVVAYRFEGRGVVCFSVMSGCPVGCTFCGTGKKFIRNLHSEEMRAQINAGLDWVGERDKIQIMSMSMGEPMLNIYEVRRVAELYLSRGDDFYLSTVGINDGDAIAEILELARIYRGFGLQISLHSPFEAERIDRLGNYPKLLTIPELRSLAGQFRKNSRKPAYWNYICTGVENVDEAKMVADIVKHDHLTCSVMCNTGDFVKADPTPAVRFAKMCNEYGVSDWSIFDPAGQDTIGGGCGQLLYVQEFLKKKGKLRCQSKTLNLNISAMSAKESL